MYAMEKRALLEISSFETFSFLFIIFFYNYIDILHDCLITLLSSAAATYPLGTFEMLEFPKVRGM